MFTFCPCASPCVAPTAVSPLWIACAAASPPDSNPRPESRVFASITLSSAGVTWWSRTASTACNALSHNTSQLSFASAVPVSVGSPPAIVLEFDWAVARASSQVASASPTPATSRSTGALATTCESTSTRSGFRGKKRYSSNSPSSV